MGARVSRMPRAPTGSFASRAETFSLSFNAGGTSDLNNITLANLPSCTALAGLYQYYRITSVQWRLKPNFDTFQWDNTGATGQIPYLYFLYDKSGSLGTLSPANFEACGAKPVRVDNKTILRSWKPSVRISGDNAAVPMFKQSPWMPTHDTTGTVLNQPPHMGAVWTVSKSTANDNQAYDIDVTVTVQFRKPLVKPSA